MSWERLIYSISLQMVKWWEMPWSAMCTGYREDCAANSPWLHPCTSQSHSLQPTVIITNTFGRSASLFALRFGFVGNKMIHGSFQIIRRIRTQTKYHLKNAIKTLFIAIHSLNLDQPRGHCYNHKELHCQKEGIKGVNKVWRIILEIGSLRSKVLCEQKTTDDYLFV